MAASAAGSALGWIWRSGNCFITNFTFVGYPFSASSTMLIACAQNGHWKSENIVIVTGAFFGPRTAESATGIV